MKIVLAAAVAALAVPAGAQEAQPYLTGAQRPDLTRVLPAPPVPGSAAAKADAEIFAETRKLAGSARWTLAADDVDGDMLEHFQCAIGASIAPASVPKLTRLLDRAGQDRRTVGEAKSHWGTRRPYLGTDAPICEAKTDHLAGNPDYPSGHAAHGQHVAMILAALIPSRTTELLARGREYGESRYICGSHSQSAAEAGLLAGAAIFAAEQGSSEFRADMDAAREEFAAVLAAATEVPKNCR